MAKNRNDALLDLVNASGFVFQLGLEHRVRETHGEHGWRVLYREHPWAIAGRSGFADLVVGQGIMSHRVQTHAGRHLGVPRLGFRATYPRLPLSVGE